MRVLDVKCCVGGPGHGISGSSDTNVVGSNNSAPRVGRATRVRQSPGSPMWSSKLLSPEDTFASCSPGSLFRFHPGTRCERVCIVVCFSFVQTLPCVRLLYQFLPVCSTSTPSCRVLRANDSTSHDLRLEEDPLGSTLRQSHPISSRAQIQIRSPTRTFLWLHLSSLKLLPVVLILEWDRTVPGISSTVVA